MANEEEQEGAVENTAPQLEKDWDPDRFPTSAKPVFRKTALLLVLILALCGAVYVLSDRSSREDAAERKKQAAEREFFGGEEAGADVPVSGDFGIE